MAMSPDIFVPRHLFEHCSAYLHGLPALCTHQRRESRRASRPMGLPEISGRGGARRVLGAWHAKTSRTEESRCFKQS